MKLRAVLSAIALAAIVVGGFEPFYLRVFATSGARYEAFASELPYRKLPGFHEFMLEVDRTTPKGARIAIAVPYHDWNGGYGYAYMRATYLLAGKEVVPLLRAGEDVPAPENIRLADYVACWQVAPSPAAFHTVWAHDGGMLVRPRR